MPERSFDREGTDAFLLSVLLGIEDREPISRFWISSCLMYHGRSDRAC
jgi:hypothetical protein